MKKHCILFCLASTSLLCGCAIGSNVKKSSSTELSENYQSSIIEEKSSDIEFLSSELTSSSIEESSFSEEPIESSEVLAESSEEPIESSEALVESSEESIKSSHQLVESSDEIVSSIEDPLSIEESPELITSEEMISSDISSEELMSSSEEVLSSEIKSVESSDLVISSEEKPKEPVALENSEEYLKLFSYDSNVRMELSFSDASITALSKYQSDRGNLKYQELYFPADLKLIMNGTEYFYDEVGVRMKGNTSRREIVYDNTIIQSCHFKVSFKATFDDEAYNDNMELQQFYKFWGDAAAKKARKDRNLFGLEKLDLKYIPRNDGACVLSEIFAYDRFREAGLIAPRANVSTLRFSNSNSFFEGYYEFIEPIDKQMLKRYFSKSDSKGDLYKCVYKGFGKADLSRNEAVEKILDSNGYNVGNRIANGKIGVEDKYNGYQPAYQLKTNDKNGEGSDFSNMSHLINSVWSASYAGAPLSMVEEVLDIDEFLKFSAISYLIGNFDDQRYNYNNYYIYFVPSTGKAIYIPYDWDWCLGDFFGFELSRSTPFDEITLNNEEPSSLFYVTFLKGDGHNRNISYDKSDMSNKYLNYIDSYLNSTLSIEKFEEISNSIGINNYSEINRARSYMSNKKTYSKRGR